MKPAISQGFLIILLFLTPIFTHSCKEKIEPGTKETSPAVLSGVKIIKSNLSSLPLSYTAVGTIKAGISSKLGSKLLGTIEEIYVREGR